MDLHQYGQIPVGKSGTHAKHRYLSLHKEEISVGQQDAPYSYKTMIKDEKTI